MANFRTCGACDGLVPATRAACPHCERPMGRLGRAARRVAQAAGASAFLATLMACYGGPPKCEPGTDKDGDRFCTKGPRTLDCNDDDPKIRPWADDPAGDGIDQNCDGVDGMKPAAAPAAGTAAPAAGTGTAAPAAGTGTAAPP